MSMAGYSTCATSFDEGSVRQGGVTYSVGCGSTETPKALRKRAKAVEKADKREAKAQRMFAKAERQTAREQRAARSALLEVAADKTKGYARVWAARTILELDGE